MKRRDFIKLSAAGPSRVPLSDLVPGVRTWA